MGYIYCVIASHILSIREQNIMDQLRHLLDILENKVCVCVYACVCDLISIRSKTLYYASFSGVAI